MTEAPSERQVLYALVAGGFIAVVAVLVVAAAYSGLAPAWWTVVTASATVLTALLATARWRDTRMVMLTSITLFLIWTIGTLLIS